MLLSEKEQTMFEEGAKIGARDSRELAAEASKLGPKCSISSTCGLEGRASPPRFSFHFHYNNLVHFAIFQTHQSRSQTITEQDIRLK
jgi:hypothetical protein